MNPHLPPVLLLFLRLLFYQGFDLQSHLHHPPVWRRIVHRLEHMRRILWSHWVLCVYLPGFPDGSSPWLSIIVWDKISCCVNWTSHLLFLFGKTATQSHMLSPQMVGEHLFERNRWLPFLPVKLIVGFDASHTMCLNWRNATQIAKISFEWIELLSCPGE